MTEHAQHAAQTRQTAPESHEPLALVCWDGPDRTDEITALRDLAATLDYAARVLERLLPAGRTDVRADIALLRMIAGNARGFARTMEDAT